MQQYKYNIGNFNTSESKWTHFLSIIYLILNIFKVISFKSDKRVLHQVNDSVLIPDYTRRGDLNLITKL